MKLNNPEGFFKSDTPLNQLTLDESSSNFMPPTPSSFSRLMYPFQRRHTPLRIMGESM